MIAKARLAPVNPAARQAEAPNHGQPADGHADDGQASNVEKFTFSGHETFPFRYTWLPKGVQTVAAYPDLFNRDDAIVKLGVGKNMVKSIRHWCETLKLVETIDRGRVAHPTALGSALFGTRGWDPNLEDQGTLWLLHWLLVSRRERASTWHLAFTEFNADLFTRETLVDWILKITLHFPSTRVTPSSLRRDVDVFLRTYAASQEKNDQPVEDTFDCPLVELGLIEEIERGLYQFNRGPKPSLPDAIFLFSLLDFWNRKAPMQKTLSFESILHAPGSPGAAFKLSENSLVERLEQLPRRSGLTYDDTAGMRNLLCQAPRVTPDSLPVLERYYACSRKLRSA